MNGSTTFRSSAGPAMSSYLELKRSLGRSFVNEGAVLAAVDRFLGVVALTPDSFASWCLTLVHLTPTVRRNRMRIVRNFCLYLRRRDAACFVPDASSFPTPNRPQPPHIFSEDQVTALLRATRDLKVRSTAPLHAEGLRLAVVLLYTAGLRRGELVRLTLADYDPTARTLLVRASKFHKSRLIALSADANREIGVYLQVRRRLPHDADSGLLVSRHRGVRSRSGGGLGQSLRRLFRRAEVRTPSGDLPRVHDLRHTYAVHVLLRWYQAGADVQSKLPALAAAMGHVSVASTAYYLGFVEPLRQVASERFALHARGLLSSASASGGAR